MQNANALGIVDWGIGGLGFYSQLKNLRPHLPVIYVSDSGAPPYGTLSPAVLLYRLEQVIGELERMGASSIVIACNAASTVLPALSERRGHNSPSVTGIIEHGVQAVRQSSVRSLGIIGGARTIRSGAYRQGLRGSGIEIRQRIAQPLSGHIEAGRMGTEVFNRDLDRILEPLRSVEGLLLACTHYPAAASYFRHRLPDTLILDPAEEMLRGVLANLDLPGSSGVDRFYTSGDPVLMRQGAASAFGVVLEAIESFEISQMRD